jgi:hypothetical protein
MQFIQKLREILDSCAQESLDRGETEEQWLEQLQDAVVIVDEEIQVTEESLRAKKNNA